MLKFVCMHTSRMNLSLATMSKILRSYAGLESVEMAVFIANFFKMFQSPFLK